MAELAGLHDIVIYRSIGPNVRRDESTPLKVFTMKTATCALLVACMPSFSLIGADLKLAAEPSAISGGLHQPLEVRIAITNAGGTARECIFGQTWELSLRMQRRLPDGRVQSSAAPMWGRGAETLTSFERVTLRPGETRTQTILLNEWFDFEEDGNQTVRIEWPEEGSSVEVSVALRPREPEEVRRIADELFEAVLRGDRLVAPRKLSVMTDEAAVPALARLAANPLLPHEHGVAALARIESPAAIEALVSIARSPGRGATSGVQSVLDPSSMAVRALQEMYRTAKRQGTRESIERALQTTGQ
jgi:hypothetical protein